MAAPQTKSIVAADSDEARQLLDAIDRWLKREVEPQVMKLEHDDVWPAAMVERMKAFGLFGATISPHYGGLGLSAQLYARIVARISETWMSLTGIFNSHLMMALLVEKYGSEFLKRTYLPRFATGEIRGGWRSRSRTPAPTCRRSAHGRGRKAAATASTTC